MKYSMACVFDFVKPEFLLTCTKQNNKIAKAVLVAMPTTVFPISGGTNTMKLLLEFAELYTQL
jgi:hypothetical protein